MAEPVSIDEAKAQCRMVEDDSEDTFIESLIAPARAYVERITRFFWVAATRTERFNAFGDYLEIFRGPIATLTSITYGPDGTGTSYSGAQVNLGARPVRIYPAVDDAFPELDDGNTIIVTFTSGALSSTSEEYLIGKRAMLILIAHWFEYRESAAAGIVSKDVDFTVRELLDSIRPVSAY